jgi:hypothetical protein
MQLQLDEYGRIPADWPRSFYRVFDWRTGRRIADFSTSAEAHKFAIDDAAATHCRYDHKVSQMHMTGAA